MTATDAELRDRAILFARRRGASLSELGRRHKLSRERVRQIFEQAERSARSHPEPADELSARLRNAIEAEGCQPTPACVAQHFTAAGGLQVLKRVPNLGAKSIAELNSWLQRHGQNPVTEKQK